MIYTGKCGIEYEVSYCTACNTDSIYCETCDNSSCNGSSCDICNEDFDDFNNKIVGKYLGENNG